MKFVRWFADCSLLTSSNLENRRYQIKDLRPLRRWSFWTATGFQQVSGCGGWQQEQRCPI